MITFIATKDLLDPAKGFVPVKNYYVVHCYTTEGKFFKPGTRFL